MTEGWCTDPYGVHEARWMSAGTPTKLVRGQDVDSYNDPPSGPPRRDPVRMEGDPDGQDDQGLQRPDDLERTFTYDPDAYVQAAEDVFARAPRSEGPGFMP